MFASIRRITRDLKRSTSGNATLLVAIGMPALIGGSGLAVDIAQWYMWQREMQFAVDQAALAGAWARSNNSSAVQGTYTARANQEYNANLSMVGSFDSTPSVTLANYNGGTNNSVVVSVTATKQLPFSSFLTGNTTTVLARAQATFTVGQTFSACMLATHPTASQAFKFGGSVDGNSACGVGTLSSHPTSAMFEAGNTNNNLGNLVATGGIDMGFSDNGVRFPNTSGLTDPYASLTAPSSSGQTSYSYPSVCPTATSSYTAYTATVTPSTVVEYVYVEANNASQAVSRATAGTNTYTGTPTTWTRKTTVSTPGTAQTGQTITAAQATATFQNGTASYTDLGSMQTSPVRVREVRKSYIRNDYTAIVPTTVPANDGKVYLQPGIYSSIPISCPTVFNQGIYWVASGIDFGQNLVVTATGGVMFVITGTSGAISINSNSNVTLNGITYNQLTTTYGVSAANAEKMAGMLLFDKNSTAQVTVNGNSDVKFGGTLYMPNRDVKMNGNGAASGVCMMIASRTIDFLGNFNLNNLCTPSNATSSLNLGGSAASVKLVA
jgi:Flp pilus assembly protein TadG